MDGVLNIRLPAAGALDAIAGVARGGTGSSIERALAAARELLGMRLAYLAELQGDDVRFHALDGDGAPFGGPVAGMVIPRRDTLCDQMLNGSIGNVIPDVVADPAVDTSRAPGVGAYVGVPVRLGDGTVLGSLCCVSDHPEPALQDRDARILDVLARIIADQVDREREQRRVRAARGRGDGGPGAAGGAQGA